MPWRITKRARFVRAHNATRATGVGAVESPRWWEMYFSQSLTSAQDLLHQAGRLDRLPTARRRRSLRSHGTAMLNNVMISRCSRHPAARRAPRVCLAAADDAAQRHRCKRQQRCHVPVSSRATVSRSIPHATTQLDVGSASTYGP